MVDKDKDNPTTFTGNFTIIRKITEKVYYDFAKKKNFFRNVSHHKYTDQIDVASFIYHITENKNKDFKYDANLIIKNGMYHIKNICNIEVHPYFIGFKPTINTVNSLIYTLKDILLWYKQNI